MCILQVACYGIAVGLFFFLLCVFSWMLAEGLHIYFMVVRVFDSGRTRKLFYLLIGWGKKLLFVYLYFFLFFFISFSLDGMLTVMFRVYYTCDKGILISTF